MLKLIYLESSLYVEWLDSTVEKFMASRKILAISTGQNIHIQCSYASMLVKVKPAHSNCKFKNHEELLVTGAESESIKSIKCCQLSNKINLVRQRTS